MDCVTALTGEGINNVSLINQLYIHLSGAVNKLIDELAVSDTAPPTVLPNLLTSSFQYFQVGFHKAYASHHAAKNGAAAVQAAYHIQPAAILNNHLVFSCSFIQSNSFKTELVSNQADAHQTTVENKGLSIEFPISKTQSILQATSQIVLHISADLSKSIHADTHGTANNQVASVVLFIFFLN